MNFDSLNNTNSAPVKCTGQNAAHEKIESRAILATKAAIVGFEVSSWHLTAIHPCVYVWIYFVWMLFGFRERVIPSHTIAAIFSSRSLCVIRYVYPTKALFYSLVFTTCNLSFRPLKSRKKRLMPRQTTRCFGEKLGFSQHFSLLFGF